VIIEQQLVRKCDDNADRYGLLSRRSSRHDVPNSVQNPVRNITPCLPFESAVDANRVQRPAELDCGTVFDGMSIVKVFALLFLNFWPACTLVGVSSG
jgi:hypothetical protein